MKPLYLFSSMLFILIFNISNAQDTTIKIYFKKGFIPTEEKDAVYYSTYKKVNDFYYVKTYKVATNTLYSVCTQYDISLLPNNTFGLELLYYDSGKVSDSILRDGSGKRIHEVKLFENGQTQLEENYIDGILVSAKHYYPDGELYIDYLYNQLTKQDTVKVYDSLGNLKNENFVYYKQAEFRGGKTGWIKHLEKNLNPMVPVNMGAPAGVYQVLIRFLVHEDGSLSDFFPLTNYGYGVEQEAMRVLKKSPNWSPMIYLNKIEAQTFTQPVTFVVNVIN